MEDSAGFVSEPREAGRDCYAPHLSGHGGCERASASVDCERAELVRFFYFLVLMSPTKSILEVGFQLEAYTLHILSVHFQQLDVTDLIFASYLPSQRM